MTADVWSVGCIMGELLGRKPLFPGRDTIDQFWRIAMLLGAPDDDLLTRMISPSARAYVKAMPAMERKDLKERFPDFSDNALDLLSKMLQWDPEKRPSAAEALAHPFFEEYHDEESEPTSCVIELPHEDADMAVIEWKKLIWNEITDFHANKTADKAG